MVRMFGMMPRSEIEIEKRFEDGAGLISTIQAGKNGWTILFADHSSEYQDFVDTAENNFSKALEKLCSYFSILTMIDKENDNAVHQGRTSTES